ncbi:MAG: glycosyltransferase [Paludibacter sp.]
MNENVKVSVIVPCYNQAQFLPETLDSVLAQTYQNWECIIVNDGSTDNTESIAIKYCNNDRRFKYVIKPNGGLSSARNAGITESKGDFLQFLDSDDILLPEKLAIQATQIEKHSNVDICISHYRLFSKDKNLPFDTRLSLLPYDLSLSGFLYSWNVTFVYPPVCYFVKKSFLVENNIHFSTEIKAWEDWHFLVQMSLCNANFHEVRESLALYRRHASNMTNNVPFMTQNMIKATFLIYELLPSDMKLEFKQSIDIFYVQSIKDFLNVDQLTLKANSLEYKIGKAILNPIQKGNMFLNRVNRKISKIINKK